MADIRAMGDCLADSFGQAGYRPTRELIPEIGEMLARRSMFRWRWLASRLHIFVFLARIDVTEETVSRLDVFMNIANDYAIRTKGSLRGMQKGICLIPIAVVEGPPQAAIDWARKPHGRRFAAITWPVLIDSTKGEVHSPEKMLIGALFVGYLRTLTREIIAPCASRR